MRRSSAMLACLIAAVSCGTDNQSSNAPLTTVPEVTAPAATETPSPVTVAPPDTDAPTSSVAAEEPPPADGDLAAASVTIEPLAFLEAPTDTTVSPNGELWIAEREGIVVEIDHATGKITSTVLDISAETTTDGERGLLGLAVADGFLFINYTDLDGDTHVDAFRLDANGRPGDRRNLLVIDQPFSNHNGGGLAIGPDGHLYIGVGDGGLADDPLGAGQDPTQILGSILRIEPTFDDELAYAIPADNPYADGVDGQPEIFMIGARNPWRISFDPPTGNFWIADVGQNRWEEIDLSLGANGWGLGGNLGWALREGTNRFTGDEPPDHVDPVFEYSHDGPDPSGCSVSGGRVYRGSAIPDLVGSYVFGDFCTATLWAISIADGEVEFRDFDVEVPGGQLVGIGVDAEGELLAYSLGGTVSRVIPG